MWWIGYALFTARAQQPTPPPEIGTLQIEAIDTGTWAMELWRRAVARIERQWRRATRRSDTPIAEPELPDPEGLPIEGVLIEISKDGAPPIISCTTDAFGVCSFEIAAGLWDVMLYKDGFTQLFSEVRVKPGQTVRLPLRMAPYEYEDVIITMNLPLLPQVESIGGAG